MSMADNVDNGYALLNTNYYSASAAAATNNDIVSMEKHCAIVTNVCIAIDVVLPHAGIYKIPFI